MLRAAGAFFASVAFLGTAFLQKDSNIDHVSAYVAISLIGTLYLISIEKRWLARIIAGIYIIGILFKWRVIGPVYSCALSGVIGAIILIWVMFLQAWKTKLFEVEAQRHRVDDDIRMLRDKYDARSESLSHLERQVTGLLNLFEVARDFNECLSYDELMQTLNKKVRTEIPYHTLSLAILDSKRVEQGEIVKVFVNADSEDSGDRLRSVTDFDRFCLEQVNGQKKVVQFTASSALPTEMRQAIQNFPLWIFAIQTKENNIATLTIQGAADDDFPKYELLAAQLALQIRKIELYETVKELSIVDGLTKLFVRRHFLERFEEELKRAINRRNSLSVLLLDIDHFKSYNDTFGHLVGDGTLREVAGVLREHVRKVDLVARYGGEEFVVVMPEITNPYNIESAERIRSAVAKKKFRIYDEETKVTVSIGLASFPADLDDPNVNEFKDTIMLELIQKADKALYRAKEDGRNRVVSYHLIQNKG